MNWDSIAYDAMILYIGTLNKRNSFMCEDLRAYAERLEIPAPNDKRAWGKIVTRASREGLIVKIGYAATSNPLAHGTPATVWRKV